MILFKKNNDRGDPNDQRPQRKEHKKDEAIEEFIDPRPNIARKKERKRKNDHKGRKGKR